METTLKKAIKSLGMTQEELHNITGISLTRIKNISAGRTKLKDHEADTIQEKTGISSIFLLTSKGGIFEKDSGSLSKAFGETLGSRENIQFYPDVKAQAGNGYINDESSEVEIISLPKTIIKEHIPKSSKIDAIKVHGDSMYPTLKEDDIVFVLRGITDIIDNKIYVIRYSDEIRIKRIFKRMNNKILLRSDNSAYPDEEVDLSDSQSIAILGRAVYNIASLA